MVRPHQRQITGAELRVKGGGTCSTPPTGLRLCMNAAGGYSRWLPEHPNTLLHEVGEEGEGPVGLMHCTFPSADQMRCRWGMPFEPAIRPEERDEVLVFDRGDGASAPVPCERVVERALIGPYLD
jgi:hypothetical protein